MPIFVKRQTISRSHKLTASSIDAMSQWLWDFMAENNTPRSDIQRLRLTAEEVLGIWAEELGSNTECVCESRRFFGRASLKLSAPGRRVDPREVSTLNGTVSDAPNLLTALGLLCEYRYENGCNVLRLCKRDKPRKPSAVVLSLFASLLLSLLLRFLAPEMGAFVSENLITPVFDTFLRILKSISGPLIFLAVVSGIIGMGDFAALGKTGKKLISQFLLQSAGAPLLGLLLFVWFLPMSTSALRDAAGGFRSLMELVLDFAPDNIVDPFRTGNAIQIIFLALCLGLALLAYADAAPDLCRGISQLNMVVQLIMNTIGKQMPLLVFVSVFNFVMTTSVSELSALYPPLLLTLLCSILWLFICLCNISLRYHEPFVPLVKKILPAFLIALGTASSAAAFDSSYHCCREGFGIPERVVNFGLPLGQTMAKPMGATLSSFTVLCFGLTAGVEITPLWVMSLYMISVTLAVTGPPVPGGHLSALAILFAQMGIPTSYMAAAISLSLLTDFPATAINVAGTLCAMYVGNRKIEKASGEE